MLCHAHSLRMEEEMRLSFRFIRIEFQRVLIKDAVLPFKTVKILVVSQKLIPCDFVSDER